MGYNVKVIKYDSEIQVNFYEHGVMVTDKHFMTDAEKKELKEKNAYQGMFQYTGASL